VTIHANPEFLTGFLLALVRASAWIAIVPPFATRAIPAMVKIGIAAAIALPMADRMTATAPTLDGGPLIAAAVLQVAIGLSLGFVVYLLFAAVQAAGELIDLFGGFTVAPAYDPLANAQSSTFGRFYQLLATTLLFVINGHILLLRGFMTSFDAVSITGPSLDDFSSNLLHTLSLFFLAAVEIAAPLLAALFLSEVALGLLSRAAPQMNVFMLGFPIKILLTLLLGGLALPLLPGSIQAILDSALRGGADLMRAFTGG
jgi:flagellar biosynthetic protein FliR